MDPIRKQLRQRLELELMIGGRGLPRLGRLPAARGRPTPLPDNGSSENIPDEELAVIESELRECPRCRLAGGRGNLVFGEGNPKARVVFVGEAPGADEDRLGRPFVGRAGKLLDDIITKGMGLGREDVYICNVCKCRPPENRTPSPDEMAECLPFLLRQLAVIRPKVIVALGATAAQGLLKTAEPVGRLRGQTHPLTLAGVDEPIPVVVTYHPAYLLRNYSPEARGKVWQDIQVAMKIAGIPLPGNRR